MWYLRVFAPAPTIPTRSVSVFPFTMSSSARAPTRRDSLTLVVPAHGAPVAPFRRTAGDISRHSVAEEWQNAGAPMCCNRLILLGEEPWHGRCSGGPQRDGARGNEERDAVVRWTGRIGGGGHVQLLAQETLHDGQSAWLHAHRADDRRRDHRHPGRYRRSALCQHAGAGAHREGPG